MIGTAKLYTQTTVTMTPVQRSLSVGVFGTNQDLRFFSLAKANRLRSGTVWRTVVSGNPITVRMGRPRATKGGGRRQWPFGATSVALSSPNQGAD